MLVEQIIPQEKSHILNQSLVWNRNFVLKVKDERCIDFLNAISKNIFSHPELRTQAQFVALAFWLRKSNINSLLERAEITNKNGVFYTPVGIVFHVCPSNVDTMFVYSLAISLLMGNKNILRISKRNEIGLISNLFEIINSILKEERFAVFNEYISVVSYGHEEEINNFISKNVDARVIWGGDQTINTFKKFESSSRTKDIVFADRVSCSIISTNEFLNSNDDTKSDLVKKFYNDTYVFDQKGCSSPQAIFIYGDVEKYDEFKNEFSNLLGNYISQQYNFDSFSIASLKINSAVADIAESIVDRVDWNKTGLFVSELSSEIVNLPHSCGAGYFYLVKLDNLQAIKKYINKKTQTLTYFGFGQLDLEELITITNAFGIDRIVPIGSALDFDFMWDGYNLFEELSSKKVLKYYNYEH